jgi:LmbE family N-acetylglucosaminyl deacetylase
MRPRLLVVLAHPDDESIACGGTLARCADAGIHTTLVCVTRGHAGELRADLGITRETLPGIRESELRDAAAVLGIHDLVILEHRDGLLPWRPAAPLVADIERLFLEVQPDVVITFGEDGLYWHPDHVFVADRTTDVVVAHAAERPCTLYGVTLAKGAIRGLVDEVRAGREGIADAVWGVEPNAYGIKANPPTVSIDVRPVIGRKLRALHCHRSQLPPSNALAWVTEAQAALWLGTEFFHVVEGSPRTSSVLDGIAVAPTA